MFNYNLGTTWQCTQILWDVLPFRCSLFRSLLALHEATASLLFEVHVLLRVEKARRKNFNKCINSAVNNVGNSQEYQIVSLSTVSFSHTARVRLAGIKPISQVQKIHDTTLSQRIGISLWSLVYVISIHFDGVPAFRSHVISSGDNSIRSQ